MPIEKCPKCGEEYDSLYSSHSCKEESHNNQPHSGLGFWGYVWAIGNLILAALTLLVLLIAIGLSISSQELTIGSFIYLIVIILFESLFIISPIGLLKRKKWGLYLTFVCLSLGVIGIILEAIEGEYFYLMFLVIAYLWFSYFYRRRYLFS
jgi:hypothetical protein